jgi:hypothetical protein
MTDLRGRPADKEFAKRCGTLVLVMFSPAGAGGGFPTGARHGALNQKK